MHTFISTRRSRLLDEIYEAICRWIMRCYRVLVRELWFDGFCQLLAKFNTIGETDTLMFIKLALNVLQGYRENVCCYTMIYKSDRTLNHFYVERRYVCFNSPSLPCPEPLPAILLICDKCHNSKFVIFQDTIPVKSASANIYF